MGVCVVSLLSSFLREDKAVVGLLLLCVCVCVWRSHRGREEEGEEGEGEGSVGGILCGWCFGPLDEGKRKAWAVCVCVCVCVCVY